MSALGDRHAGDLDGTLVAGRPIDVAVLVDGPAATVADQHALWMLLTLLVRLEGVVAGVHLVGPEGRLSPGICPVATAGGGLLDELSRAAREVGGPSITSAIAVPAGAVCLHIGHGPGLVTGWRVVGEGWRGRLTRRAVPQDVSSCLPFGPYAAACLAVAELFRSVRLPKGSYEAVGELELDVWEVVTGRGASAAPGREDFARLRLDAGLAGVGAVGTALLHTIWACKGLGGRLVLADADLEGIDTTNLNRCVLFDRRHVGWPKASTAAVVCARRDLLLDPVDGPYDREQLGDPVPAVLLSAVDSNESRHGLQRGLVPARAFGASTLGLRAELVAFGPPGVGPCLACHNPVVAGVPDDVRRADVREMAPDDLDALAVAAGATVAELRAWAATGDCGSISAVALGHLFTANEDAPLFAVGFVSVLAGVLLATALVADACGIDLAGTQRKLQLLRPQVAGNGQIRPATRDRNCSICGLPTHQAIWRRRWSEAR